MWLAEVGPLSTGFTPQGVPRLDACCVPLTPLSTRSSLRERSLMPLKGAPPRQTQVQVLWHTEVVTALTVPRPSRHERTRPPSDVVSTIATLAATPTDAAIAALLNARGLRSGKGHAFTATATQPAIVFSYLA